MSIIVNGVAYSLDQLKKGEFHINTPFEKSTLEFCNEWLSGKELFEIQTSGSTGAPKQISFTRTQLEASAKLTEKAVQLKKGYTALVCLDTKYIAGQMMLVRSFVTGMNILAIEPSANPFQGLAKETSIDFVALVPYQIQAILASEEESWFNRIGKIIIGGAPFSPDHAERLQHYSCSFYATYGMTETLSNIALQKLNGEYRQDHFHPVSHVTIEKDGRGCLVANVPHASKDKIITNDLIELNADQSFKIIGRLDNLINTGGVKISPEVVENKIKRIFSELHIFHRFFIAGQPDQKLGNKIVLIIEGEPIQSTALDLLTFHLKSELLKYEIPKEISFISKFIETETQKVNRKKTLALL